MKGVEGDLAFNPHAVPGLTLNLAGALNSAKYASSFLGACYNGQTIAEGCGPGNLQQFDGRPLPRAPHFSGSGGFTYEAALSSDYKAVLNANGVYTSRHYLSQELTPVGVAGRRVLVDSSISVGPKSGLFEVALIGRNLTNKYYPLSGFQTPGTGSGTGTNVGVLSDFEGPISRGREIWLKLTVRP